MNDLDLETPARVHIVGIGGAGMSAIASVLAAMGHVVSGSDLKASPALDRLRAEGIEVHVGHDPGHVDGVDWVARSTAVPDRNVEVVAANDASVPVFARAEVLGAITATRRTISVAGTHGKTTTSSMLAVVLADIGLEPGFIIGGDVHQIGSGAVWSGEPWFVVEADESDGTFVALATEIAVVTNVEPDHLGTYGGDFAVLESAFGRFVDEAATAVICTDDPGGARLASGRDAITVGEAEGSTYRITSLDGHGTGVSFSVRLPEGGQVRVDLPVPGTHNARNAATAFATAVTLGGSPDGVARSLSRFGGVARRFEFRGETAGIDFVDDYAHLPTEVAAAIDAAVDGDWDRVVVVFQPHRYTRMAELADQFADRFAGADHVLITEIYSAGESPIPGVSGRNVADGVRAAEPTRDVVYQARRDDLVEHLVGLLRPGDLCLTLGAGDLTTLPDEVRARLLEDPQ